MLTHGACIAVREALILEGGRYIQEEVGPAAPLDADVRVFACGPWLSRLFPDLGEGVVFPTRQEIYYFGTPPGSQRYAAGSLPVWLEFGERVLYGLPDVGGRGFKFADDTRGAPFDPTDGDRTPGEDGIARARRFLAERFPELAHAPLLQAEVCQYENSPDGHLLLDRHPERSDLWLVGGGSGHGFKLGPAVGELAAAAILSGKSVPEPFRLERLRGARRTTQFERGR